MLSKKYYQAIADAICKQDEEHGFISVDDLVADLATYFKEDNPSFDKQRFYDACYKTSGNV